MKNFENAPRIYVGTYGQYNSGSLFGKWFELADYADLKGFLQDCYEFHRNEFDSDGCRPELMFQDWENIPDSLISECSIHKGKRLDMDTLRQPAKWTMRLLRRLISTASKLTGLLSNVPQTLERYLDYEAFCKGSILEGYSEYDGHAFADY